MQVGQLWSLLDAMLPCAEPPRNRRGGVVSQSLNSGRSKDELLVKLLEVVKGTAPANTTIVPNKDYTDLATCPGAGLVALNLSSLEVEHASHALDDMADWLHPAGLAGNALLPLLHREDAGAFTAFTAAALRDYTAGDASVVGRTISVRMLKRCPGASSSVRGPEWLLVYTAPKTFTLTSVGAGGVAVLVADLRREGGQGMGVQTECVRNIIDSKMLNCEYDLAAPSGGDVSLGALPPWSAVAGAGEGGAAGGVEKFDFQLTGDDELRMQRRTSLNSGGGASMHTCWFGRAVSPLARSAPRGRSTSGSFGSAEFDRAGEGAVGDLAAAADVMYMVMSPLSCELQAIQLSRRSPSPTPASWGDHADEELTKLGGSVTPPPLVTTFWSWSVAGFRARVCSSDGCVEVVGKAIPASSK